MDTLRITYFGNCGTIYSIVWNNNEDDADKMSIAPGEWVYPFDDEIICILIDDVLQVCGNAFLDEEDIFKVIISNIELESLSTLPN